MDTSVRFQTADLQEVFAKILDRGGVIPFVPGTHSIFSATDPQMYAYLPSNTEGLMQLWIHGANSVFLYRTEEIYSNVFKWWVYCAIDDACIAPPNSTKNCPPYRDARRDHYPTCHRQDQSALNILLANLFDFNSRFYSMSNYTKYLRIRRGSVKEENEPIIC